jgi:nucleotide-binding universal stress UspA family protein
MRPADMSHPIVVGVDGTDDALRAIEFAVGEAQRWNCGLRLVNAVHETVPMTPMLPLLSSETLLEVAEGIMAEAVGEVDRLSNNTVPTEQVVETGPAVRAIIDAAQGARSIVLGHRSLHKMERLFSGNTTVGVAARAECPVVSVSSVWNSEALYGRIVVGVDGSSASREVLSAAFDEADARRASLLVLHAWRLPSAYDDLVESSATARQWRTESEPVLAEILAGWGEEHPDVQVGVELAYERTAEALVSASRTADLVVVGRHGHGGRFAGWTGVPVGSTARTLLAHAYCPVLVAPHSPAKHVEHDNAAAGDVVETVPPGG